MLGADPLTQYRMQRDSRLAPVAQQGTLQLPLPPVQLPPVQPIPAWIKWGGLMLGLGVLGLTGLSLSRRRRP